MKLEQYAKVRIKAFGANADLQASRVDERAPQVGDVAVIVELYANPPGYELECVDPAGTGKTLWLRSFRTDDVELELVQR